MGAGKSTVGQILAKKLQYRFCDTDTLISQAAQRSIPEIFAQAGEDKFRDLETQVLAAISPYTRTVVATGGGIVLRQHNWSYLQQGLVVWLDVPVEILAQRLKDKSDRPLLSGDPLDRLREIRQQRLSLYAEADLAITLSGPMSPSQVSQRILESIPSALKQPQKLP